MGVRGGGGGGYRVQVCDSLPKYECDICFQLPQNPGRQMETLEVCLVNVLYCLLQIQLVCTCIRIANELTFRIQ